MPPKKKARKGAADDSPVAEPVMFDGWTDEQETTLFKAISVYRLKPAGMHKHFRMVGISELMKNHGVSDSHTNIEGIWRKLKSLYNLEGLDEREDMEDEFESPNPAPQFSLPEDEYGHLMSARRLDPASTDSPPATRSENSFATSMGRYKKGRAMRSASIDESTTNSAAADDTEDESSLRSTSPSVQKGKKATPSSTRARKQSTATAARRRSLPSLNKPKSTPHRRTTSKATPKSAKDKEKDKESTAGEGSHSVAADDDDDDDELSDVPDDVDMDDTGTVAETENGDEDEGEDRSEMGESTNAGSPPPATPTASRRGGYRGRGTRGRGGKRGGVRRSTRKK
ncbi:hypothetical protein RUND412_006936 [Rhizina undulata]